MQWTVCSRSYISSENLRNNSELSRFYRLIISKKMSLGGCRWSFNLEMQLQNQEKGKILKKVIRPG